MQDMAQPTAVLLPHTTCVKCCVPGLKVPPGDQFTSSSIHTPSAWPQLRMLVLHAMFSPYGIPLGCTRHRALTVRATVASRSLHTSGGWPRRARAALWASSVSCGAQRTDECAQFMRLFTACSQQAAVDSPQPQPPLIKPALMSGQPDSMVLAGVMPSSRGAAAAAVP